MATTQSNSLQTNAIRSDIWLILKIAVKATSQTIDKDKLLQMLATLEKERIIESQITNHEMNQYKHGKHKNQGELKHWGKEPVF